MRLVFDSNVLVSSLDPNDTSYSECRPLFEALVKGEVSLMCPTLVLVETACAIRRRTSSTGLARDIAAYLATSPHIEWMDLRLEEAESACALGIETGLRGADAVIVLAAEQQGVPLVTKDQEIRKRAPESVTVIEPAALSAKLGK